MGCKGTLDRIPYFNISTSASRVQYWLLVLQYEINEALFLTEDEQIQIENLYIQIFDEYQKTITN
jgi:hypothetical protein